MYNDNTIFRYNFHEQVLIMYTALYSTELSNYQTIWKKEWFQSVNQLVWKHITFKFD